MLRSEAAIAWVTGDIVSAHGSSGVASSLAPRESELRSAGGEASVTPDHLERVDELTPYTRQMVMKLLRAADQGGIDVLSIDSASRTCAQQNALFSQSRDTEGPMVTEARGCQSWHVLGRAVDLSVAGGVPAYAELGALWKSWGGGWGGDFDFQDYGHFEWHPGMTISGTCPTGTEHCDEGPPWADDRPLLSRPGVQAVLGITLAGAALVVAHDVLRPKARLLPVRVL